MVMNQIFDQVRGNARMVSRPGFDIILAIAQARQTASPTTRLLIRDDSAGAPVESALVRRRLLGSGLKLPRRELFRAARFFDSAEMTSGAAEQFDSKNPEVNGAFTRAFQPLLKPCDVTPLHQADGMVTAGQVME